MTPAFCPFYFTCNPRASTVAFTIYLHHFCHCLDRHLQRNVLSSHSTKNLSQHSLQPPIYLYPDCSRNPISQTPTARNRLSSHESGCLISEYYKSLSLPHLFNTHTPPYAYPHYAFSIELRLLNHLQQGALTQQHLHQCRNRRRQV